MNNNKKNNVTIAGISKYNIIFDDYKKQDGVGSSLKFKEELDGKLYFYGLTDRGPILDGPKTIDGRCTKLYAYENFSPYIAIIEINPSNVNATVISTIDIKMHGQKINGLPRNHNRIDTCLPLSTRNIGIIQESDLGMDVESITLDKNNNFWIAEEHNNIISKLDSNGNIIETYSPGKNLPAILDHFTVNMGFESITSTSNGKIYSITEGVLNINNETNNIAQFMRILELDPKTKQTKMFAYPYKQNTYMSIKKIKIGDMETIDDTHFLVIEQSISKTGEMLNFINLIDISDATDISNITLSNGQDLEYASLDDLKSLNINLIKVSELINTNKYGWNHEKLEGITLINNNTIAIINDNDFGITDHSFMSLKHEEQKIQDYYVLNLDNNLLYKNLSYVENVESAYWVKNSDEVNKSEIWIIELEDSIYDFL